MKYCECFKSISPTPAYTICTLYMFTLTHNTFAQLSCCLMISRTLINIFRSHSCSPCSHWLLIGGYQTRWKIILVKLYVQNSEDASHINTYTAYEAGDQNRSPVLKKKPDTGLSCDLDKNLHLCKYYTYCEALIFTLQASEANRVTILRGDEKIMVGNNDCMHVSVLNSMTKQCTATPCTHTT